MVHLESVSDKIFCCLVAEVFVLSDFSRSARNDSRKCSSCELRPHTCNLSTQSLSNVKHLKHYLAKNGALQIEENWEFIHSKCFKLTLNYTYLISSPWFKKILKFIPSKCFILPLKKVRDFWTCDIMSPGPIRSLPLVVMEFRIGFRS